MNIIKDNSYFENNSIISNTNSLYKDIESFPNNYNFNKKNSGNILDSLNQSRSNYIDNSVRIEDSNYSFDSKIINNVKNIIDNNTVEGYSQIINTEENSNQNYNYINNKFNENSKFNNNIYNNIQKMFLEQNELLEQIKQEESTNNNNNSQTLNELKENLIQMIIFDPKGNVIEKMKNINEVFYYLTDNFISKNKKLSDYDLYIINEDKKIDINFFYMSIFNFLMELKKK